MPRHRLVDSATWKSAPEAERADLAVVKAVAGCATALSTEDLVTVKDLGADPDRTLPFTLSDIRRDRDGDRIDPAGWDLANFAKNPVVPWAHDYKALPVAKAVKTWVGNSTTAGLQLKALKQFARADENPFADTVFRLLKGGYLNACSVGFVPVQSSADVAQKDDLEGTRIGMHFTRTQLLESSIVPVPSHPGALYDAKGAGVDLSPYVAWCEKALDEHNGAEGLWVPRSVLEQARVVAKGSTAIIFTPSAEPQANENVCQIKADEPVAPPVEAAPEPAPASAPEAKAAATTRTISVSSPEDALAAINAVADYLLGLAESADPTSAMPRAMAMRIDNAIDLADGASDLILDAVGAPDPGDDGDDEKSADAETKSDDVIIYLEDDAPQGPQTGSDTYELDPEAFAAALRTALRGHTPKTGES